MRPPYAKLRQTRSESDDECAIKHEESSPVVASVGRTERLIWFCVVLTLLIKIVLLEISHAVTPSRSFSYEMGFATDLGETLLRWRYDFFPSVLAVLPYTTINTMT